MRVVVPYITELVMKIKTFAMYKVWKKSGNIAKCIYDLSEELVVSREELVY